MRKHGLSVSAAATAVVAFLSGISALGLQSAIAADSAGPWGSYKLAADPSPNGRTVIEWGRHHRPLKVMYIPPWGSINGTTIRAYDPGTRHVRMQAKADFQLDVATYYRPHGTRDYVLELSPATTTIRYFDATGKKVVLEQMWWRHDYVENGETKHKYEIFMITQMDSGGKPIREFSYRDGALWFVTDYHATVGDVKYAEVDYLYDMNTHTLAGAFYWRHAVKCCDQPTRKETYTPADNIAAPAVPQDLLKIRVNLDKDELPAPPVVPFYDQ